MTAIWNNPATPNGPAQGNSQQAPGRPGQPQPGEGQNPQNQQGQQAQQARPMGGPVGQATATAEAKVADETAEKQEQPEAAEAKAEVKDATDADAKEATEVEDAADGDADAGANVAEAAKPAEEKVEGLIEIADEVVEKVSALAALEVDGVVDLGGDVARLLENVRERIGVGQKRGDQGVKASITGDEVTINLTIVVEYGHVVMDVARNVQSNVAEQAHKMLGLRVAAVNVKVDDVQLPQAATAGRRRDDSAASGEGAAE
ncbi:Asp23/Gls24 family envelope stress response protein [Flindersiella endophytica]